MEDNMIKQKSIKIPTCKNLDCEVIGNHIHINNDIQSVPNDIDIVGVMQHNGITTFVLEDSGVF